MSNSLSLLVEELRPFAEDLYTAAQQAGLSPRITSTKRSRSEQQRLYQRYLDGLSLLPAAPPGGSAHEYGWAFDMVVTPYEALSDVGAYWRQLGGEWGSRSDPVHFQLPGATQAAKMMLKGVVAQETQDPGLWDEFTTWLFTPGGIPSWAEGALKLIPGVSAVSWLAGEFGIR